MASNVLKGTLTVKHGDDEFVFRVPSIKDDIRIGQAARLIRAETDPNGYGGEDGLDENAVLLSRFLAMFRVLFESTSAPWLPIKTEQRGKEMVSLVDTDNIPNDRVNAVAEIGLMLEAEVARFRAGGAGDRSAAGAEAVAGQPPSE